MTKLGKLFLATLVLRLTGSLGATAVPTGVTFLSTRGANARALTGSMFADVGDFNMGYDCALPAYSETINLTTGHTMTRPRSVTFNATFGDDGRFSEKRFVVDGSPPSPTWTKDGSDAPAFSTLVNGTTIDPTTLGGIEILGGSKANSDAGGSTRFPFPIPEPGTLTLVGCGLIGLGWFARRFRARKTTEV